MPNFVIKQENIAGGVVMLTVSGFLDAHTYEELEQGIASVFAADKYKIIVKLSGVSYISSAGAGVFIWAMQEAQESGGNIVLLDAQDSVMEVFKLLGLDKVFNIVEEQTAAISALA